MNVELSDLLKKLKTQKPLQFIIGFILLFLLIEGLSLSFHLPNTIEIYKTILAMWKDGLLLHDISVSSARWIIGWSIGSSIGILFGILTGRSKIVSLLSEGLILILRAIPFIALVPLVTYIFGLSETGKFFIIGWACFSVTWAVVHQGSKGVSPFIYWKSKSLGLNKVTWIFKVLLSEIKDSIFSALRTSLSLGLIVVAVAELSGVYEYSEDLWWSEGIGHRIFRASDQARDNIMMASILVFSFLGIFYDFLLTTIWSLVKSISFQWKVKMIKKRIARIRKKKDILPAKVKAKETLTIKKLTANYSDLEVFKDFETKISPGSILSIVGHSGCGKTTLLKSIGRYYQSDLKTKGEVLIGSNKLERISPLVGIVFQNSTVFKNLTIWENIIIGNNIKSISDKLNALYLIESFGLKDKIIKRASSLSGGQQQRLALASAIANKPILLLLDEPFGALDAITRKKLQDFFKQKIKGRITSIFVTHDIDEALIVGDKIRIGVSDNTLEFQVNKDINKELFEFSEQFLNMKRLILSKLEDVLST